ncbi:C1 family peptidase [Larkinella rosea]|uniref:Peptidase C1A papain C-terminal domain-containing protein n=1 Tax=Larkinella rosea TaxID=2025312 RepID=A0A3P1BGQ4_9BACT|nr:C1 family peptidase [Larkinella rosea]RRB00116.1 hypothetical protein EHT25_26190 [Larkinella rosea]
MKLICVVFGLLFSLPLFAQEEFTYGLIMDDESYLRIPAKPPVIQKRGLRQLPPSLSYEAYCPRPLDQGKHGTCLAIALGYYLRTIMEARRLDLKNPAEINKLAFSPTYLYEEAKLQNDPYCQKGLPIDSATNVIRNLGIIPYSALGYPACSQANIRKFRSQAKNYRVAESQRFFRLDDPVTEKVSKLKNTLTEGLPVVISMLVPPSFFQLKTALWEPKDADVALLKTRLGELQASGKSGMGHAICVLGYDDQKFGGAFRIVNSQGTGWGDKGFGWVKYNDLATFTRYGVQLYQPMTETATYQIGGFKADVSFEQVGRGDMPLHFDEAASKTAGMLVYRMDKPNVSGDKFKFLINNDRQAYLFAFGTDERPNSDLPQLFPYSENRPDGMVVDFSPLMPANATVAYPPTSAIELDSNTGTDYFLLLFANHPVETSRISQAFQRATGGSVPERLRKTLLPEKPIDYARIRYESNRIAFTVEPGASGNLVPVLILIDHR